jgi:membrane protein required for colicin V production
MEDLPINVTDLAVIVVLLLSGLFAFVRGFIRELLSVISWVGAALVALYSFEHVRPFVRSYVEIPIVADGLAIGSVFIIALIIFSAISHMLSRTVRHSGISAVDRSLGLLFGSARGALVVCLAWLLIAWVILPDDRPAWLTEAKSLPLIQRGSAWLTTLVPESIRPASDPIERSTQEEGPSLEGFVVPAPKDDAEGDGAGYNKGERQDLNRLLDAINSGRSGSGANQ